ncbi:MAG: hypothetical protein KAW92_11970 [Candidatus Cloacimonetes bacterium]|nr:hypothetical protein [Candidatus Cloacimonadota bacterium]
MGTQQVLLIVLSVIIVGVAVAVGITMFSTQSSSSNREAIKSDLMEFGSQAIAFYKAPAGMAGGGKGSPGFGTTAAQIINGVGRWCGFGSDRVLKNDNGNYLFSMNTTSRAVIYGVGKQKGQNPNFVNTWHAPPPKKGYIEIILYINPEAADPFTWNIRN